MSFIFTNLLVLLCLVAIGAASRKKLIEKQWFRSSAVVLFIAIFSYLCSVPALAADSVQPGAIKHFVSQEQRELEEDLNLTPGGSHYSGIEHIDRTSANETAASDEAIEQTLEEFSSDDVKIAVANGSVKLSGTG